MTMIRLLLVESQPTIRFGLRMRLGLEPDVTVVGEADDSLAALSRAAIVRPDVILVDVASADIDTPRLIEAMRRVSPESAVVVLSLWDDTMTRWRALAAGAAAFVSKHEYGDRLVQAIREAAAPSRALPAHRPPSGRPAPGFEGE